MKSKLTIAFLQNLKDDKVNIQSLTTATCCTPGQLLDFINLLMSYKIVKIANNEIVLVDKGDNFTNFKRLNVNVTKTFKSQEISRVCDKMNETLFALLNYLYNNEASDEGAIVRAFPNLKNINNALILLQNYKVIARLGGEYYCALGKNDFKIVCEQLKAKGITLGENKDNDFVLADFCFGNCEFTENVDCLKNPTAILCDLYFNCETEERKRKLMIENLNLFAKYRTAINMKNSEFAIVDELNSTKTALDFNAPLNKQIATQIKAHKENGEKIRFWVSIKHNTIR